MANRGFEYEESRLEGRAFLVPAGLSTPAFNSNFDIPALPESSREGALGAKVDVRPPAQLLTVVPGSQVVANASEPTVAFYALSTSQSVERDTWAFLMNFLAEHKVTTEKLDQQDGVQLVAVEDDEPVALIGCVWSPDGRERHGITDIAVSPRRRAASTTVAKLTSAPARMYHSIGRR